MEHNYNNYLLTQKLLSVIPLNNRDKYEYTNIIERFLLNRANTRGIIHTFDTINATDKPLIDKMNEELKQKQINININTIIDIFNIQIPISMIKADCILTDNSISYRTFTYPMTNRIKLLLTMGTKEQVMTMLLRYASIVNGGQQWSIPFAKAKKLFENGYKYEGFASPLNSNLLPLGGKYCSLFPDTDVPFGSLGAFDYEKINRYSDGNWILNPPYTEYMLLYTVTEILKVSTSIKIYMIIPNWQDAEFYKVLVNTPFRKTVTLLKKQQYCYYCAYTGITIPAKFDSNEITLQLRSKYRSFDTGQKP